MRSTYTHFAARARQVIAALTISLTLSAGDFPADSVLLDAYLREDMSVWKEYVDRVEEGTENRLLYEYGYCGYIVAEAKKEGQEALMPEAKRYVRQFKEHVNQQKAQLSAGHYEMYLSAVYVFELRLHESIHPIKAMNLAKEATRLAPEDPVVLSYYGTSLFYAPKPFGDKKEALEWFTKAEQRFREPQWQYCWLREATRMYIDKCKAY
jgi:hypothetical protein